jgi:hypothetical protein
MERHYEELALFERDGFEIIVDKTWEDLDPADCFDDSCYDIKEIYCKIDAGVFEWFMLRVRVFYEDVELGSDYVGGFLYEDPRDVLNDGVVEDMVWTALEEAKARARELNEKLGRLVAELDPA